MAAAAVVVARLEPLHSSNESLLDGLNRRPDVILIKADDTQRGYYQSSVVLGRGPVSGISDRSIGKHVLKLSVNDPFAIQHAFVKVTMLRDSDKAHITVNGRQWRGRVEETRWLRCGDTLSLDDTRYGYKVNVTAHPSTSSPPVEHAALEQSAARQFRLHHHYHQEQQHHHQHASQAPFPFGEHPSSEQQPESAGESYDDEEVAELVYGLESGDEDVKDDDDSDGGDSNVEFMPLSSGDQLELLESTPSVHSLSSSSPSPSNSSSSPADLADNDAITANQKSDSSSSAAAKADASDGTTAASTELSTTAAVPLHKEAARQVSDCGADGVLLSMKIVDKFNEDVQCAICLDIIFRAQTLVPCGHSFCEACIKRLPQCPNCRKPSQRRVPANQLDNLISTLISVPGLLNVSDVHHYHERKEEYEKQQRELDEAQKKRRASAASKVPARKRHHAFAAEMAESMQRHRGHHLSMFGSSGPNPPHIPPFASAARSSSPTQSRFRSFFEAATQSLAASPSAAAAFGASPPWSSTTTSPTAAQVMMMHSRLGFPPSSSFNDTSAAMPPSAAAAASSSVRSRRGGRMPNRPTNASAPGGSMANAICID